MSTQMLVVTHQRDCNQTIMLWKHLQPFTVLSLTNFSCCNGIGTPELKNCCCFWLSIWHAHAMLNCDIHDDRQQMAATPGCSAPVSLQLQKSQRQCHPPVSHSVSAHHRHTAHAKGFAPPQLCLGSEQASEPWCIQIGHQHMDHQALILSGHKPPCH